MNVGESEGFLLYSFRNICLRRGYDFDAMIVWVYFLGILPDKSCRRGNLYLSNKKYKVGAVDWWTSRVPYKIQLVLIGLVVIRMIYRTKLRGERECLFRWQAQCQREPLLERQCLECRE